MRALFKQRVTTGKGGGGGGNRSNRDGVRFPESLIIQVGAG